LQDPENLDPGVKILREFKKDSTGAFYKTIFRVFSFQIFLIRRLMLLTAKLKKE